jgi:hypothetical protein
MLELHWHMFAVKEMEFALGQGVGREELVVIFEKRDSFRAGNGSGACIRCVRRLFK